MATKTQMVALQRIRIDGGTQPRSRIDTDAVDAYFRDMIAGAKFPPIMLFFDGVDFWLADGFHRFHAACLVDENGEILAEVRNGTVRDAVLYAVGANAKNGIRRTNADKRQAVIILLKDEEWAGRSDRWIAEQCAVGNQLVGTIRKEYELCDSHSSKRPEKTVGRDGKSRPTSRRPQHRTEHVGADVEEDDVEEIVAAAIGVTSEDYRDAKLVVRAAKDDPETFGSVVEEMDRTGNVHAAANKVRAIQATNPDFVPLVSVQDAAAMCDVDPSLVELSGKVILKGSLELQQAVTDGKVTVQAAVKVAGNLDEERRLLETATEGCPGEEVVRNSERKECDVPERVVKSALLTCPKCGQLWPEKRPIHG